MFLVCLHRSQLPGYFKKFGVWIYSKMETNQTHEQKWKTTFLIKWWLLGCLNQGNVGTKYQKKHPQIYSLTPSIQPKTPTPQGFVSAASTLPGSVFCVACGCVEQITPWMVEKKQSWILFCFDQKIPVFQKKTCKSFQISFKSKKSFKSFRCFFHIQIGSTNPNWTG